jgi:hypothetical protein
VLVDIPCVTNNNGTTTVPCPFRGEGYIFEPNNPDNPKGSTGIGLFGLFGPTGILANTFSNAFKVNGTAALFIFDSRMGLSSHTGVSPSNEGVVVSNRFSAKAEALFIRD